MWEAFQHAGWEGLDNLTAIIDVNRLGQTRETMLGWDVDGYVRRIEAFGWNAIAIDGHDVEAIEQAYTEAESTKGKPTAIVARTKKGKGVKAVEDQPGKHGKPLDDPDGGDRGARRRARPAVDVAKPAGRRAAHVRDLRRRAAVLRARRRGRHAQGLRRGDRRARVDPRRRRRARRRGVELDALGGLPRGPSRTATSRCSSPSSSSSAAAVGIQVRGWVPFASTFAAFFSRAYDFVRMARDLAREHPPVRLARRRLDRRGRPVADGAGGHRVVPRDPRLDRPAPERRQPDGEARRRDGRPQGHLVHPHAARQDAGAHRRRTRPCTSAAAGSPTRATTSRSSPAGSRSTRRSRPPSSSPSDGVHARVLDAYSIKPIDADAVQAAARECGAIVTVEDHWPEGGLGDAVLEALAGRRRPRPRRQARGPRDAALRHARGAAARGADRRRGDRRRRAQKLVGRPRLDRLPRSLVGGASSIACTVHRKGPPPRARPRSPGSSASRRRRRTFGRWCRRGCALRGP